MASRPGVQHSSEEKVSVQGVKEFLELFTGSLLHLAPWFLAAVLVGVLIQCLALDVLAVRAFKGRGARAVFLTAAIGAFSPFCSFTVIPLIRRLLRSGVPLSAVMAFWVASPTMDPEIWLLSASAFGVPIANARLVGALVLSLGAGLIVLTLERRGVFQRGILREQPEAEAAAPTPAATGQAACLSTAGEEGAVAVAAPPAPTDSACSATASAAVPGARSGSGAAAAQVLTAPQTTAASACAAPAAAAAAAAACAPIGREDMPWRNAMRQDLKKLTVRRVLREIVNDTVNLGRWLLLAIALETAIVLYVPAEVITDTLGSAGGTLAIPLAAVISVPAYLNGVGAIPVVSGLLEQGMSPGAAVTFLLGGAVSTVPAIVAVRAIVKNNVLWLYLGVALLGSVLVGYVAEAFL